MTFGRSQKLLAIAATVGLIAGAAAAYLLWPVRMAPPPDIGRLDASAEKGRYLATISNCVSCHTTPDGTPFAGGVPFHTPFGLVYSTNITSDVKTGIGSWTFEDFHRSMKHGVRPDGTHLYPAFPYTSFAKLTDDDIASIYLYMQSVEPATSEAKPNDLGFPFNLRVLMRAWNKLFHDTATYEPDEGRSQAWNRGAYLVEGPAHCGACHTPRNALGAERSALALTGGVLVDEVSRGKYRKWSAVNLTPAATGLGAWSVDDVVAYLKEGENTRAVVHGPMNEVVMNSTRHLSDADAQAVASYLKSLPAREQPGGRAPHEEQLQAGEIAYTVHCGSCHLPTGFGDPTLGVSLAGNAIVQAADPASLINVVLYGPKLPPPPFGSDRTRMKPFGKRLSAEDIANLASYVRTSFGNQASAVAPRQVVQQR